MNSATKKILLSVLLVAVLAVAFFAAYTFTMKQFPDPGDTAAPAASLPEGQSAAGQQGDAAQPGQEMTAAALPGETLPGETDSTTTVPAATDAATTAAPTEAATANAGPADVDSPTYIGGIMVVNKSYPLPRNYNPGGLTDECENAFDEMQAAAEELGLDLYVASGFRSYDLQASLYQRYCNEDGQAAADTYSARPGHSEHQSGLAIDLNSISSDFAYTAEGQWVNEHCWEYGFILRYPADKVSITGYMYEPWHIRYVGKDNARAIYNSGLCLEEYLGIDSVYNY